MQLRQTISLTLLTLLAPALAVAAEPAPAGHVPLEPLGYVIVAHATVGGQTGTFMFDTGEGVSVMTPAFAQKIGCKPWGQATGFRLDGQRLDGPHCDGITVEMPGVKFNAPALGVFDVASFFGPGAPPIDGILGLDAFAGHAITLVPGKEIIVETPESLEARTAHARELPVRLVRDVQGLSLTVDGAVQTPAGLAYMELDTGDTAATVIVGDHIAPLLGMKPDSPQPFMGGVTLANGIVASGPVRTEKLIMDGNIGADFLNHWIITMDLEHGRLWLSPLVADAKTASK